MDPKTFSEGLGLVDKILGSVVRRWRRRHPLNPLVLIVREEWAKGYALRREIELAPYSEFSLRHLTGKAFKWGGDFHLRLADESPVLYERFKQPNRVPPESLGELRRIVRADMKLLRRIERNLRLPWLRWTRFWRWREPKTDERES